MSDFVFPSDVEINLPNSSACLGKWLKKNGLKDEITAVFVGKSRCFLKTYTFFGEAQNKMVINRIPVV